MVVPALTGITKGLRNGPTGLLRSSTKGNAKSCIARNSPCMSTCWRLMGSQKRVCRGGAGCPGGHEIKHEPAMHPCSKEGQQPPGLHYEEYYHQVKIGGATHLECCVQLWIPQQKRHGHTGDSLMKGHKDNWRIDVCHMRTD